MKFRKINKYNHYLSITLFSMVLSVSNLGATTDEEGKGNILSNKSAVSEGEELKKDSEDESVGIILNLSATNNENTNEELMPDATYQRLKDSADVAKESDIVIEGWMLNITNW